MFKQSIILLLLSTAMYAQIDLAEVPTYANIDDKSWDQILMENTFQWRPPFTVHLPIQPVHSADWVFVDAALNVSRRHVTKDVPLSAFSEVQKQETWNVQFAFEDPPFVPDAQLSTLSLSDNAYPVVTGDYHSRDMYYQIEYVCSAVDEEQSLLWLTVTVTNESERTKRAHVRTKISFQRENDLFDYHYKPFYWDASKWLPCDRVKLANNSILKDGRMIGKVVPGSMEVEWEGNAYFQDKEYNVNLRSTRESGFVLPHLRLKEVQDVIHAQAELKAGESGIFSLALLVNDKNISGEHLSILKQSSGKECCEEALAHFKNQFTDKNTAFSFQTGNWQDIFTELQISMLQMMVKHPGRESLMITQGGSSERFFVWVTEGVQMLKPMLRTGHFKAVRRGLDFIFSLQDAGVPPKGRFTSTEGTIGTTGPRWIATTGSALTLASDYYLYSNDRDFLDLYLPRILKAAHWITGELRATRKLNPDGTRPSYYGLMPFGTGTDGDDGYIVSVSDNYTFQGLEKTVQLLERIGHDEAVGFRRELELYRNDLTIAIEGLSRPDGNIERAIAIDDKEIRVMKKFENAVSPALYAYTGTVDPGTEVFQRFIKYFEENRAEGYFMGNMDREIAYMGQAEYAWQYIYLSTGQWKKAFAATQVFMKYGMTQDTYQVQERFSRRNPFFTPWQPNGSGSGKLMDMMLNSLYFESDQGVTLLGAIPFAWLRTNNKTELNNLYTTSGIINLEIKASGPKTCTVSLSSVDHNALPKTIRFPEYFNAKASSPSVEYKGHGVFKLRNKTDHLVFIISDVN